MGTILPQAVLIALGLSVAPTAQAQIAPGQDSGDSGDSGDSTPTGDSGDSDTDVQVCLAPRWDSDDSGDSGDSGDTSDTGVRVCLSVAYDPCAGVCGDKGVFGTILAATGMLALARRRREDAPAEVHDRLPPDVAARLRRPDEER